MKSKSSGWDLFWYNERFVQVTTNYSNGKEEIKEKLDRSASNERRRFPGSMIPKNRSFKNQLPEDNPFSNLKLYKNLKFRGKQNKIKALMRSAAQGLQARAAVRRGECLEVSAESKRKEWRLSGPSQFVSS